QWSATGTLLLAVDDPQVALVVELADVAGVEPTVRVDDLGGLLRFVEVAGEDVAALAENLSVFGELDGHAGEGAADRSRPDPVGIPGERARCLGQPVELGDRHSDREEPLEQLDRYGDGSAHRDLRGIESEEVSNGPEDAPVQCRQRVLFGLGQIAV